LQINRYSKTQASASTGAMSDVLQKVADKKRRYQQLLEKIMAGQGDAKDNYEAEQLGEELGDEAFA
jgi:hypothetical protein